MFAGIFPILATLLAMAATFSSPKRARGIWAVAAVLVIAWAFYHGSYHAPELRQLGAW